MIVRGPKGEGKIFSSPEEIRIAYDSGEVDEQARIKVRIQDEIIRVDGWPRDLVGNFAR